MYILILIVASDLGELVRELCIYSSRQSWHVTTKKILRQAIKTEVGGDEKQVITSANVCVSFYEKAHLEVKCYNLTFIHMIFLLHVKGDEAKKKKKYQPIAPRIQHF